MRRSDWDCETLVSNNATSTREFTQQHTLLPRAVLIYRRTRRMPGASTPEGASNQEGKPKKCWKILEKLRRAGGKQVQCVANRRQEVSYNIYTTRDKCYPKNYARQLSRVNGFSCASNRSLTEYVPNFSPCRLNHTQ